MKCFHCNQETTNPKFCTQSCAAKHNNKLNPKRQPQGKCKRCSATINTNKSYCSKECRDLSRVPRQRTKNKLCPLCGVTKDETNSFAPKGTYYQSYCRDCNAKKSAKRARVFKQKCVDYKGGCCETCGYNKCVAALDFHHKDPTQKDFSIAQQKGRVLTDTIKAEIDKCSILCSNCHREEHYRLSELKNHFL